MFPVGKKVLVDVGRNTEMVTGEVRGYATVHFQDAVVAQYVIELDVKFWGPVPDRHGTLDASKDRPWVTTMVAHPDCVRYDIKRNEGRK